MQCSKWKRPAKQVQKSWMRCSQPLWIAPWAEQRWGVAGLWTNRAGSMLSAALLDANQASGGAGQSAESADLGAGRWLSLGTQRSWQKFSGKGMQGMHLRVTSPLAQGSTERLTFELHFKAMCIQCFRTWIPEVGSAVTGNVSRLFWWRTDSDRWKSEIDFCAKVK